MQKEQLQHRNVVNNDETGIEPEGNIDFYGDDNNSVEVEEVSSDNNND